MCDYSLHHVASRPAQTGDKLVTTPFGSTATRGFCAIGAPHVAVCLQPGTELAFESDVITSSDFSFLRAIFHRKPRGRVAQFRQVNLHRPNVHHDALEFPDGEIVMLTSLRPGQEARVLQTPPSNRPSFGDSLVTAAKEESRDALQPHRA
jgi:hypothetical protein